MAQFKVMDYVSTLREKMQSFLSKRSRK